MYSHFGLAPLPTILLLHIFSTVQATNFTFSFGNPTQCDSFPVSWSGGAPPFEVVLIPEFGTPRTIDVPSKNFSNSKGSFQTRLPFPSGKRFLVTMSDSNGFASGGISPVQTVGNSTSNTKCNTTDPGVDFYFELNTALQQCRPYTFSNYTDAVQPITINGVIPGGTSFILDPPKGPSSFEWGAADIAGGTQVLFIMSDSKGRKGGSSAIWTVGLSDDQSCLNSNSPVSVSNAPSATASATSDASSTSGASTPVGSTMPAQSNTGAIIGGVVGGLFAAVSLVVLMLFFLRRRKTGTRGRQGGFGLSFGGPREGRLESMDLDAPSSVSDGHPSAHVIQPYPYTQSDVLPMTAVDGTTSYAAASPSVHNLLGQDRPQDARYDASTFSALQDPFSPAALPAHRQSQSRHTHQLSSESGALSTAVGSSDRRDSVSSAARRKAAMAGLPSYKPTPRYILHTDLEETQEEQGDVIELPPQYSERRTPISGLASDYTVAPPGAPPNPLEHEQDDHNSRLQRPIEPGPPTPTATAPSGKDSPS